MKTYREIAEFMNVATVWSQNGEDSKFKYAVTRMQRRAQKALEKYNEKVEDLRVENCAADEKGIIMRDDQGRFHFTKEGLQKFNKEARALLDQKVEIEPYFATQIPKNLDEDIQEVFTGFVIKAT